MQHTLEKAQDFKKCDWNFMSVYPHCFKKVLEFQSASHMTWDNFLAMLFDLLKIVWMSLSFSRCVRGLLEFFHIYLENC